MAGSSAAAAAGVEFEGEITLTKPILAHSLNATSFQAGVDMPSHFAANQPARVVFEAHNASIRITEQRWQGPRGMPQLTNRHPNSPPAERFNVSRVLVELTSGNQQALLWSQVNPGDDLLRLGSGTYCEIAPADASSFAPPARDRDSLLDALGGSIPRLVGFQDVHRVVAADCRTSTLRAEGVRTVQVFGLLARLDFWREGSPLMETRILETGPKASQNPMFSELWDHSSRILVIGPREGGGQLTDNLTIDSPGFRVKIAGPKLGLAATLQIPAATGYARWGTQVLNGTLEPIDASGAFLLEPKNANAIRIKGFIFGSANLPEEATTRSSESAWGLGLGGLLLVAALGAYRCRPALITLLSWMTRRRALAHPLRQKLLELAAAAPGVSVGTLATATGHPRRVVDHHLAILARHGLIAKRTVARRTQVFVPPVPAKSVQIRMRVLGRTSSQRILASLSVEPRLSQRELARRTGLSQPYVCQVLASLRRAGVVPASVVPSRPPPSGPIQGTEAQI